MQCTLKLFDLGSIPQKSVLFIKIFFQLSHLQLGYYSLLKGHSIVKYHSNFIFKVITKRMQKVDFNDVILSISHYGVFRSPELIIENEFPEIWLEKWTTELEQNSNLIRYVLLIFMSNISQASKIKYYEISDIMHVWIWSKKIKFINSMGE